MSSKGIIQKALTDLGEQAAEIQEQRNYYNGKHPLRFISDKMRDAYAQVIHNMRDNLIPNIVETTVDRMNLTGFAPDDPEWEEAAAEAWDHWQRSRMPERLSGVLEDAGVDDYAGLIVWPDDDGVVRIYPQKACSFWAEQSEDRPGELAVAVKLYTTDSGVPSIDVLYPDVVEVWQAPEDQDTVKADDYQLVETIANPLGVVPARLIGPGLGEVRKVIPTQDLLNRSIVLHAVAGEGYAEPLLATIGLLPRYDENTGARIPWIERGTNKVNELAGKVDGESQDVEVVQIEGADPTPFREDAREYRAEMARQSRTPAHLLLQSGDFPSGKSLKTAEASFVAKVNRRKKQTGPALAEIAAMAVQLAAFGATGVVPPRPEITAQWDTSHFQDNTDDAEAVEMYRRAGMTLSSSLQFGAGWSAEEADAEQARAAELEKEAAERAQIGFDNSIAFGV